MPPPTRADLYGYSLSQFSAERLSRLLLATTPNLTEKLDSVFPAGTYFGNQPQLPFLISLVRARFPGEPSPVLDKVWLKDGIEADVAARMYDYFQVERRKDLETLEARGEGELREGRENVELLRLIQELNCLVKTSDASRAEEAAKLSALIWTLQQRVDQLSPSPRSRFQAASTVLPLASTSDWTDLSNELSEAVA
ncbi:hypothetical protein BDY24DRAFT_382495 [Mrakia frigida]|uniref:uncharacterized protein n=1 Tax=Mrakia frigida TaxID=29902 RepID=UPI003FCC23C1